MQLKRPWQGAVVLIAEVDGSIYSSAHGQQQYMQLAAARV
jgi:hypothetical protein